MSAEFLTTLKIEKVHSLPRSWILADDLVFRSARYPGLFVAPRGFQTDFASIPRFAWVLFPKVDVYDPAAVIHDAAYANALTTWAPRLEDRQRIFTAKFVADHLFLEGMEVLKVRTLRRRFMYRVVSLGGRPEGHPLAAHRQYALPMTLALGGSHG